VSVPTFYVSLLTVWAILYIALPIWLIYRGWPFTGGFIQLIGAFLPGIWQAAFWSEAAGNFGLLMILLVPIPLCIMIMGLYASLGRAGERFISTISARLQHRPPSN
jgi:hypothetical protein